MSEHTKGRLHQCSHSDKRLRDEGGEWVADTDTARRKQEECSANARRLAAAWNVCEGIDTESLETGATLADICERANGYQFKLNAARALLRELLDDVCTCGYSMEFDKLNPNDWENRVRNYLDACDTLEGK